MPARKAATLFLSNTEGMLTHFQVMMPHEHSFENIVFCWTRLDRTFLRSHNLRNSRLNALQASFLFLRHNIVIVRVKRPKIMIWLWEPPYSGKLRKIATTWCYLNTRALSTFTSVLFVRRRTSLRCFVTDVMLLSAQILKKMCGFDCLHYMQVQSKYP